MGGPSADRATATTNPILWQVNEAGGPSSPVSSDQVLAQIAAGRLGFASAVRRVPDGPWARAADQREFGYAFPYVNLPTGKPKRKGQPSPVGLIAMNSDLGRALAVAGELVSDPKARNLNFFCSAYLDWLPAPLLRRTHLFQMWDGFWIAPIVESGAVKPGGWLNLYLVALNLKDREQQRTLRASDAPIAEGMRGSLSFALPPYSWTIQMVSVPATGAPGFHKVSFKTRSGAERAATAVAVGVLTLGSFVYAPGSSGFNLQFEILAPETSRVVESWENFAVQAANKRFEAAHAIGVSDSRGGRISKESVLQRFRSYLTPALVARVLKDNRRPPDQVFPQLLDEFLFDWLGLKGAEGAFLSE